MSENQPSLPTFDRSDVLQGILMPSATNRSASAHYTNKSYQDQSHQQLHSSTPIYKEGTKRNSFNMSSLSSPSISSYSKYPTNSIMYDPQQYSFSRTKYSPTQDHSSKVSPGRLISSPPRSYTPSSARQQLSEMEKSTIQKQRRELQLLIAELQDRDRELNEMVASHQKQMLAWERDRQRLLTLEQKCTRLQGEVKNRNDQVRSLTTRLKVIQSQDQSKSCALQTTQKQLEQLSEKASASSMQLSELQEENGRLNALVQNLTNKAAQLEGREHELLTIIRLKDRDLTDATSHITELTAKFKKLDFAHKESKHSAASGKKEVSDWKNRYKEIKKEAETLKVELEKQAHMNLEQKVEMGKLQEAFKGVERELELSAEREKRKDQLIQLQHSKQERIDAELTTLRQAYSRQHRDMSLLQLNLESEREKSREENKENENPMLTAPSTPRTSRTASPLKIEGISPLGTPRRNGNGQEDGETESVMTKQTEDEAEEEDAFSDTTEDQLLDTGEGDASPTTKLHKLLSESRQMVANLEQSTLPPYIQDSPKTGGEEESESMQTREE